MFQILVHLGAFEIHKEWRTMSFHQQFILNITVCQYTQAFLVQETIIRDTENTRDHYPRILRTQETIIRGYWELTFLSCLHLAKLLHQVQITFWCIDNPLPQGWLHRKLGQLWCDFSNNYNGWSTVVHAATSSVVQSFLAATHDNLKEDVAADLAVKNDNARQRTRLSSTVVWCLDKTNGKIREEEGTAARRHKRSQGERERKGATETWERRRNFFFFSLFSLHALRGQP